MAEYCLECMNEFLMYDIEPLKEEDVTVDVDLCEGCGKIKPCVISIKNFEQRVQKRGKNLAQKNDK